MSFEILTSNPVLSRAFIARESTRKGSPWDAVSSRPLAWWYAIPAALAWLLIRTLDPFSRHGQAIDNVMASEKGGSDTAVTESRCDAVSIGCSHNHRREGEARIGDTLPLKEPIAQGWGRHTRAFVAEAWIRFRKEAELQSTIRSLESLDDRTLRDIGIPRCSIEYSVRHGANSD